MEIIDNSFEENKTGEGPDSYKSENKQRIKSSKSNNSTAISSEREKSNIDYENSKILKQKIDEKNHRFPYCIVWTPLPCISWFLPFIGHTGICGYIITKVFIIIKKCS